MSIDTDYFKTLSDRADHRVTVDITESDDGRDFVLVNFEEHSDDDDGEPKGYIMLELCDKTKGVNILAMDASGDVISETFVSFADLVGSDNQMHSKYVAYNHNHIELGQFNTRARAQSEADYYRSLTGNAAYVELSNV